MGCKPKPEDFMPVRIFSPRGKNRWNFEDFHESSKWRFFWGGKIVIFQHLAMWRYGMLNFGGVPCRDQLHSLTTNSQLTLENHWKMKPPFRMPGIWWRGFCCWFQGKYVLLTMWIFHLYIHLYRGHKKRPQTQTSFAPSGRVAWWQAPATTLHSWMF